MMKRDWELIRALLLEIEGLDAGHHFIPRAFDGQGAEAVAYHVHLMCQAGLIECSLHHPWNGGPEVIAKSLTLAGHDLLDMIRDQDVWERKKAFIIERLGSLSFDALRFTAEPALMPHDLRRQGYSELYSVDGGEVALGSVARQ